MVEIVPFQGLLYDQKKCGPIKDLIAPPYDVIKPDEQKALYKRNPYNVVRLILGKEFEHDNEMDNRYTRSSRDLLEWLNQGILMPDNKPRYYAYTQTYQIENRDVSRIGFFARVRLEDFNSGNICPHEFTLAKAKKDRTYLLEACRANLSPVFGLFSDPSHSMENKISSVINGEPLFDILEKGVTHKFWLIDDDETISFLTDTMADKKIYIADGHHRYETALAYSKSQKSGDDSNHIMMFLTNLESDSLTVFAIHRLVKSPNVFDQQSFLSHLKVNFNVQKLSENLSPEIIKSVLTEEGKNGNSFIVYMGPSEGYLLKVNEVDRVLSYLKDEEPVDLKVLDVIQLHAMIIRPSLGVDTRLPEHQEYLSYTTSTQTAINEVNSGKHDVAFFMNPTPVSQVRKLAEKGVRLPQKATYFYPKLLSGLVFNKFQP